VRQRGHRKDREFYFFYGKEGKIINWEKDFLYTIE
jgi:hypothetical protein